MARKRKMKVGSVRKARRKIRGQKRSVFVKKVSSRKYLVRLAKPRVSKKRLNYGRAHKLDRKQYNRRQQHEIDYKPRRKTSIWN